MTPSLLMASTVPDTLRGFLLPYARHFRDLGWRVDAMASGISNSPECVAGFDRVWDAAWSRRPRALANFTEAPRQVRDVVVREGYDLVHVHTPVAAFVARRALRHVRRTGRPVVVYTAHGFHFYQGGPWLSGLAYRTLERMAGRWTDHLVVINREDEFAARRYGIVPPERLHYMPGIGVETAKYAPEMVPEADVARVRRELRLGEGQRLFLMVAEFNPGKRHVDALRGFARLDRTDVHLAFAGVGPVLEDMRRLAADLGVANRVHFLGYRRDVPTLIRASVATLLPSEREGLPRSVMESLSLGVPVVGTKIRGVADLVEGACGLLVPVGAPLALGCALSRILEAPEEAQAMGTRGRQRMAAYDIQQLLERHERLYQQALEGVAGPVGMAVTR